MNPNIIAGLVKNVYPSFNMFSFENRFRLQKFTYMLQHMFKLDMGYDFNFYTYGPYCMELAREGFQADFDETPKLNFKDENYKKRFEEFISFFNEKKLEDKWLEIASSLHFLNKIGYGTEQEVIEMVMSKRNGELSENEEEIKSILKELKSGGFI